MSNFLGIELKHLKTESKKPFKMALDNFLHFCLDRCRYFCVSVDNKEQKKVLQNKEFIDFIRSFGYKIYFENICESKKNLPQNSYFCFMLNSKSINAILKSSFLKSLFFNQDIICLDSEDLTKFMVLGYGEDEFEADILLKSS